MKSKAETRNPKTERGLENRRPKRLIKRWPWILTCAKDKLSASRRFPDSDFGLRNSFGLRPSGSDFRRGIERILAVLVITAAAFGCRRDMFHQPTSKPLAAQ